MDKVSPPLISAIISPTALFNSPLLICVSRIVKLCTIGMSAFWSVDSCLVNGLICLALTPPIVIDDSDFLRFFVVVDSVTILSLNCLTEVG